MHHHYLVLLEKGKYCIVITTVTQCLHDIFNSLYTMHILHNRVNDLIIPNLLISAQIFAKGVEHIVEINFLSLGEHCKLKHVSTEVNSKVTEKSI